MEIRLDVRSFSVSKNSYLIQNACLFSHFHIQNLERATTTIEVEGNEKISNAAHFPSFENFIDAEADS